MAAITITDATNTAAYELSDEIGSELTIGSAADCSIPLPSVEGLAPVHCRITRMEEGFAITDAGSGNGTFADDRSIESEYMAEGIVYRIGAATLAFVVGAPAAEEPQAAEAASAAPKKKAAPRRPALSAAELQAMAMQQKREQQRKRVAAIYMVVVLLAAFYAGMALYSWQSTGNPLPVFLR